MFGPKEEHPSYGCIRVVRTMNGRNRRLFGSSILHQHTICIEISHASRERSYNSDHLFPEDDIIELEMSNTQFAELVTSIGQGNVVPCTITRLDGKLIDPPPMENKLEQHQTEFKEHVKKMVARADQLETEVAAIFAKKSITKKDKEDIINAIKQLRSDLGPNALFQVKQFDEQMEKTVHEAKGEIEAFVQNKFNQIALSQVSIEDATNVVSLIETTTKEEKEE